MHDHHLHLRSLAATAGSVRLGPPRLSTAAELAAVLLQADSDLPAGAWIRGIGYHESVAGELDRWTLDRIIRDRPARVQHRSGALWTLNSRACAAVGLADCVLPGVERDPAGRVTGRLWRMDSWLGSRIATVPNDLAAVSARAAALGVTGFTDATPSLRQSDIDDFARSVADRTIQQHMHCMAPPGITDPGIARFSLGPTKILLDDAMLPALDEFTDHIADLHAAGRSVAVHCVTRVQLILTIAALDGAGTRDGDRIEHGAIIPAESLAWLRERGVPVVTQPHFLMERAAQYARDVPAVDRPDLWRLGSLLDARVGVAAGSDAPFGAANPWHVVRAAVNRDPTSDVPEGISMHSALALFHGRPERPAASRVIAPGEVADLTLLAVPPEELTSALHDPPIAATIVGGWPIHLGS